MPRKTSRKKSSQPKAETPEQLQPENKTEVPEAPKVETKTKTMAKADTAKAGFTKDGFIPDDPKNYAHMVIEAPKHDDRTGQKLSTPYPATFNRGEWTLFLKFRGSQGLEVIEILHLPEGWPEPEIFKFAN